MTPLQNYVLNYVSDYIKENDISPTYKEIYEECNLQAVPQAYTIVKRLCELGYLDRGTKNETRNIKVINN